MANIKKENINVKKTWPFSAKSEAIGQIRTLANHRRVDG